MTATVPRIATAHPQVQVLPNPVLGANAAAHFDEKAALAGNGGDTLKVCQSTVSGTVQVHHVKAAGIKELPGNGAGVLTINGHLVIITLVQTDDLAAGEVNGGKNLHGFAPFIIESRPFYAVEGSDRSDVSSGGCRKPNSAGNIPSCQQASRIWNRACSFQAICVFQRCSLQVRACASSR